MVRRAKQKFSHLTVVAFAYVSFRIRAALDQNYLDNEVKNLLFISLRVLLGFCKSGQSSLACFRTLLREENVQHLILVYRKSDLNFANFVPNIGLVHYHCDGHFCGTRP